MVQTLYFKRCLLHCMSWRMMSSVSIEKWFGAIWDHSLFSRPNLDRTQPKRFSPKMCIDFSLTCFSIYSILFQIYIYIYISTYVCFKDITPIFTQMYMYIRPFKKRVISTQQFVGCLGFLARQTSALWPTFAGIGLTVGRSPSWFS